LDGKLTNRDFIAGDSLTYVDLQVYANMKTMKGCVELEEVETLPQLRGWKSRIETNYEWPHT
jgi:glutathione S-transferase